MILSDRSIREALDAGRIVIEPFDPACVQPSSVDLHMDGLFRVFRNHTMGYIDVKKNLTELTELVEIPDDPDAVFMLHPGEFVLGSTAERIKLPTDMVGRLEGKSSLGRLGLLIHSTAGFVDAGWDGQLTLEEMQGGTFTISNGGVYGSMLSTPILNPPQSGILGLHNIMRRPMEHPAGSGEIKVRPMMYLALSYDHRIVDGQGAVTFLKHVKECIEDPDRLLLGV